MEEEADAFDAIADQLAELRMGAAAEQLDEAREIVAAGIAARPFADELRRIPPGDVVTLDGDRRRGAARPGRCRSARTGSGSARWPTTRARCGSSSAGCTTCASTRWSASPGRSDG